MTAFTVAGDVTSALTHFAQLGLADILDEELGCRVRFGWTDAPTPVAFVDAGEVTANRIGEAVANHASRAARSESWLRAAVDHCGRPGTAAFSPRIKPASSDEEWRSLQRVRHEYLDILLDDGRDGDLRFLGALGEPAYWRVENGKERRPDHGASRWEMKTRNKGEEFVGQRLLPLAEVMASRSVEQIVAGLTGADRRDELGRDKPESRTSTGFTQPGPTDSALAWCALWGIGNFPLAHRVNAVSVTPGAFPPDVLHPRYMFLPIIVGAVTAARMRSVIVSSQLSVVGSFGLDDLSGERHGLAALNIESARQWLIRRRVGAIARFRILKTGSASAPERQVLGGELLLIQEVLK